MKFSGIIILITFLFSQTSIAQNRCTISGRVVNVGQQPVAVYARLLALPDSMLLQGAPFENGRVTFSGIEHQLVALRLSSVGLSDTLLLIRCEGRTQIDLGTILLHEHVQALAGVTIRGQAPLVTQGANGTTEIQITGSILAGSTSATELLERSPGITFTEGRVGVIGRGEALIFLNGQAITYEQMAAIPVARIARVEVILNPSARYDAEGKAVINIITKSVTVSGTTGSVTQQYAYTRFAGSELNTLADLQYMHNRLSLEANYALETGNEREVLHTTRTRPSPTEYLHSDLTTDWQRKMRNYSNFGAGAQLNLKENSYISLTYKGNLNSQGGSQNSSNALTDISGMSFYQSWVAKDEKRWNHAVTLNFQQALDTLGSALFVGTQYARFQTDQHDRIRENSLISDSTAVRNLLNDVLIRINISSTQADYTKAFRNGGKFETGAKFSYADNGSGTDFLVSVEDGPLLPDQGLSSHFRYVEKVPAAYLSYQGKMKGNVQFGAGARGEWTNYILNTTARGGQDIGNSYFNVFPNLFVSKNFANGLLSRISYVSKITRPRYQALNPFVVYQDPFTTIEGNPNLQPEKIHTFETGLQYKQLDVRASYTYTKDKINGAALRGDAPNSYVLKGINLAKEYALLLTASATFNLHWWSTTNTITVSHNKLIDNQYSFEIIKPKPQFYGYTSNTFDVNHLFKIQLMAWYLGERSQGLYYNFSRSTVTVGVERDFFKNALKIRLTANDIFHQSQVHGKYSVGQTDIYYHRTYSTAFFGISAAYRFGRLGKVTFNSKSTGETEQNRAR
ncbi:TonB-dependent receptor [Dyadobacter sp. CY261]|uniref:TonB-dependent receptor domain-containing protein n=1 Tax=Dyadobacter sp. CY261 TaxID=2907203 RepID=UPI001F2E9AE4|nr:TonB-dependent receptor [Dyadobacter sp. CY261]MCF0074752.1 TonB-dependent receptor [Dyadobacter sp. CY261]